jgi:hypothetical protein
MRTSPGLKICFVGKDERLSFFADGMNVDEATSAGLSVFDTSADFREEGVVFAAAYVSAGVKAGAALAHEDAAAGDYLSAVSFCAEALRVTVAAVA